jgi:hypothetical protein
LVLVGYGGVSRPLSGKTDLGLYRVALENVREDGAPEAVKTSNTSLRRNKGLAFFV